MSDDPNFEQSVRDAFQHSIDTKMAFMQSEGPAHVATMASVIATAFRAGNKFMLCGNGGSAADAQHLAAECMVRLRPTHSRNALSAISLATDTSMLTACGNDFSFSDIFARPLAALARPGDVLLGISTSGNSVNVIKALDLAQSMNVVTLGFLGNDGGKALSACDHALVVPSNDTAHIQETHITAGHAMLALVEDILIANKTIHCE